MSEEKSVKLPTDEQLIELLGKIKEHCKETGSCKKCPYFSKIWLEEKCKFRCLGYLLYNTPIDWDTKEIERIIRL